MYVECPTCHEDIEIVDIDLCHGGWDEGPSFDYGFAEEHLCQKDWDNETQEAFDQEVFDRALQQEGSYDDMYYPDEEVYFEND